MKTHSPEGEADYGSELYDLSAAPGEHHNLYGDPAYVDMQARVLALLAYPMAQTIDPLPARRAFG